MNHQAYRGIDAKFYFWRTEAQQEIDFVEDSAGNLTAFECKWSSKAKVRFPRPFTEAYPEGQLLLANANNFEKSLDYN